MHHGSRYRLITLYMEEAEDRYPNITGLKYTFACITMRAISTAQRTLSMEAGGLRMPG